MNRCSTGKSDTRNVTFVVRGKVRIVNFSLSGREITFDDLEEGSYFGELAALDGEPHPAGIMVLTDTQIAFLPPDLFIETLTRTLPWRSVMIHLDQIMFTSTDRIMGLSTLAANNTVHADLFRQAHANMLEEDTATISPIPVHRGPRQLGQTVARLMNDLGAPEHRETNKGSPRPIRRGQPARNSRRGEGRIIPRSVRRSRRMRSRK